MIWIGGLCAVVGSIHLLIAQQYDQLGLKVFFWLLAAGAFAFAAVAAVGVIGAMLSHQHVKIGDRAIVLPRSRFWWISGEEEIAFSEIAWATDHCPHGQQLLTICTGEERYVLIKSWFPYSGDYDELLEYLAKRCSEIP